MQAALAGNGVVLITAGGGAFGAVLQQTGVSGLIRDLQTDSPYQIIGPARCLTF